MSLRDRILNSPDGDDLSDEERARLHRATEVRLQDYAEEILLYLSGEHDAFIQSAADLPSGFATADSRVYEFRLGPGDLEAIEAFQRDAMALGLSDPTPDRWTRVQDLRGERLIDLLARISVPEGVDAWRGEPAPNMRDVVGNLPAGGELLEKLFALAYARRHKLPRKETPAS